MLRTPGRPIIPDTGPLVPTQHVGTTPLNIVMPTWNTVPLCINIIDAVHIVTLSLRINFIDGIYGKLPFRICKF